LKRLAYHLKKTGTPPVTICIYDKSMPVSINAETGEHYFRFHKESIGIAIRLLPKERISLPP